MDSWSVGCSIGPEHELWLKVHLGAWAPKLLQNGPLIGNHIQATECINLE